VKLFIERTRVKNVKDFDVVVRDCEGKEYVLFPKQEKDIEILRSEKSNERNRSVRSCTR
jgi:hypothetical protein